MAATRTKRCEFTVIGKSSFPLDMLRYDQCYPKGSDDAARIGWSMDILRDQEMRSQTLAVTLLCDIEAGGFAEKSKQGPTDARWSSFGWEVDNGTVYIDGRQVR